MRVNVDLNPENLKYIHASVDNGTYESFDLAVNAFLKSAIDRDKIDAIEKLLRKPFGTIRLLSPGDIAFDIDVMDTTLSEDEFIDSIVEKIKRVMCSVPAGAEFSAMSLVSRLYEPIQEAVKPNMRSRIGSRFAKWAKQQSEIKFTSGSPLPYVRIAK